MKTRLLLLALFLPLFARPVPAQDQLESRELSAIVEEQDQLLRQLHRLRGTMEVLLARLEAEQRPETAALLAQAIQTLDERIGDEGKAPLTLEERMEAARLALESGQLVRSLEEQRDLVSGLEQLLSILLDRKDLEALDDKVENLRDLQRSLEALSQREGELKQHTRELHESSSNEAQRQLEQRLAELAREQRELLSRTESAGRSSGTMELEALQRELDAILRDQRTDTGVLGAWNPEAEAPLDASRDELLDAQREEARAQRLEDAREELERASQAIASGDEDTDLEEISARLREATRSAETTARTTSDAAAQQAAGALSEGSDTLAALSGGEREAAEAARELGKTAEELAAAAQAARERAEAARERAEATLEPLADPSTTAGAAAKGVRRDLARARRAAAEGNAEGARGATEDAARDMQLARAELQEIREALSGSQGEQAERTERLGRGLETAPRASSDAGQEASRQITSAAEAMKSASASARRGDARAARESASEAQRALESASESLDQALAETGTEQGEENASLAEAQAAIERRASAMEQTLGAGSMSEEAQAAVRDSMQRAGEAMREAQGSLDAGRASSAASSQRQAVSALREAASAAREGVTPRTESGRKRAQELARQQEKLRKELLDLARRIEDRDGAQPMPALDRADAAASEAEANLDAGELSGAEKKEDEVQAELEKVQRDLGEEEQRYQRLRDEEQLFRIAEEARSILEEHRAQMAGVVEIDGQRTPGKDPSRAQKLRLRRVARAEESLADRAREMSGAVIEQGSLASGQLLRNVGDDLDRVAEDLGERGDFETGDRTQSLQRSVEFSLELLLDALKQEQTRRKKESKAPPQNKDAKKKDDPQNRDTLVPDAAELKLLRSMEEELQRSVAEILRDEDALAGDPADVDERVLRDIARLGLRHTRLTEIFQAMRKRIGIPAPGGVGATDGTDDTGDGPH